MRTYGIDTKSGNWTLLTTTPITGASNPLVSEINSVFNTNSRITSTLYTALITFTIGSSVINNGDLLQNDVILTTTVYHSIICEQRTLLKKRKQNSSFGFRKM